MSAVLLACGLLCGSAAAAPFSLYPLQLDDGGFIPSGDAGQWEWGIVANGPGAGFNGTRAWSTGLQQNYMNDSLDYLEIPVPDLTGVARATMSFKHWYDIAEGDSGWIEIDSGSGFQLATPLYGYPVASGFVGTQGGWRTAVIDLSGFGARPRVRLAFAADLANTGDGWTIDEVAFHDGDVAPPRLSHMTVLPDTENLDGPYRVEIDVEDDTAIAYVRLYWSAAGAGGSAAMRPLGSGAWVGVIPAQPPDTRVTYWVQASDGVNHSREPVDSEHSFRVYLPAPTDVQAPPGRVVGSAVSLSWSEPVTDHAVVGYRVLRGGLAVMDVAETEALAPILGGLESYSVRALYAEGPGDESSPVLVDGVVPRLGAVRPDAAWPGESLRVHISGSYLLLVDGTASVHFGNGVEVGAVDVRDVDTAFVDLTVAETAAPGPRVLTLQSGDTTVTLDEAFVVLPGVTRPRLTRIEPESVRQGDKAELEIEFVGTLATLPTVDLGIGISIESVDQVGDTTLRVRYAVRADASLGARTVFVDDGTRVFDGVTLDVEDAYRATSRSCGPPGSPGALLVVAGLVSAMARRRRS